MPTVKCAVIAAAGLGKRLGRGLPKCLIEVAGKTILEYQLEVLKNVPEIRIVIGFEDEKVMRAAIKLRKDIIFVRNAAFQSTTTLQSFYLGARGINGKVLFLDGDMIISHQSIKEILNRESDNEFIGVSDDLSQDPVYVDIENDQVASFSYNKKSLHEWANIAYIDSNKLEYNSTHFFVQLSKYLPIEALSINRLEIDTEADYANAEKILRGTKK